LLMAKGGAELLRLSGSEEVLRQRTLEGLSRVRTSLESVTQWQSIAPAHEADEAERSFRAAESSLAAVESMTYRYFAESAGMEPLITATGQAAQGLAIAPSEPLPARVVNTWITTDGGAKPPGNVLRTGATYTLLVSVGIPSSRSIVEHPVSLPEQELAPHYRDGTLPLRVVLFSTDFGLDVTERILLVPEPPAGATPVSFPVTAPTSPGPARLRVAIYHANNLVQSIMITATVGEGRGGLAGVVEWALSANVTDVDRLGDKAVNLLVNDGPAGSHLLGVVGDDFTAQFEMDAGELERSADEARRTLQWVCGDPDKKEKYRFEPDNRSAGADFREHLSGMAELGYDLYTSLVIDREDAFETNLSTALARPVTIQAARMRSCKFVFPWALVYDHPVVPSRHNEVCPDFLAVLQRRPLVDDLMRHDCFVRGCAHREDTNIVCPSGFWGFRHVIEQPLSTVDKNAITGDALDHITVDGNRPVEMFNAYSRNLTLSEDHCRELQVLPSVRSTADFDLLRIGHGLKRTDLDIVYFYCHGGNRRGKAWLGVGARPPEELYATNLKAWAVRWLTQHPFVFINGCDTVGMLPHDLLTFNEVLVWCKAAGVMGSEIRIPETLGRAFGRRFLKEFAAGDEVGQLVRRLRLELLTGFNPLGLAYTPYCLAKLHIARAST
ncbi:MAG: hypothetical protein SYR96_20005, partial [Actinomycetota bacterium]|nr:hypothetical protein [Actinomycetota bacterium]